MTSTAASPISIEDMPVEILAKILRATVGRALAVDSDSKAFPVPVYLTQITSRLRNVALDTPEIWQFLVTTCKIHELRSNSMVKQSYLDFLHWWSKRLGNRNRFCLQFHIDPVSPKEHTGWTALDGPTLHSILEFIARGRYLEIEDRTVMYLLKSVDQCAYYRDVPPALSAESINMEATRLRPSYREEHKTELSEVLRLFEMTALRRIVMNELRMRRAPLSSACRNMWGQLTHIKVTLVTHLEEWTTFIRSCTSVESAWITLKLQEHEDDGNNSVPPNTLPNLRELAMRIDCQFEVWEIFEAIHLPALKTLLLAAQPMSLDDLHTLADSTPSLERLRLAATFPVNERYRVRFPENSTALATHAPRLKRVMLDVPHVNEFDNALREYIDDMRSSGWLRGQTDTLRLDFYCAWMVDPANRWMEDLQQYLDMPENRMDNVRITLRAVAKAEGELFSDSPLWEMCHDLGAEF